MKPKDGDVETVTGSVVLDGIGPPLGRKPSGRVSLYSSYTCEAQGNAEMYLSQGRDGSMRGSSGA